MVKINEHYLDVSKSYLFSAIAKKRAEFAKKHPEIKIISLGIGDVTRPLPQACIKAMHKAVEEMADEKTFRGYGPDCGYPFLTDAIIENDYLPFGIKFERDEIFVSDGAKCDVANIQEIFAASSSVLVTDPVYPVYLDTNIMAGRKVKKLLCREEDNFIPKPPSYRADLVYLCSPNNPTGAVMTKKDLSAWVKYAKVNNSVLIYDSAYKEYILDKNLPRSIYEIKGAKDVAIELRSYSKTAGFTGVRCAYMVVPRALKAKARGQEVKLNDLWARRHSTKFNGVSYIIQRAAQAVYSPQGKKEVKSLISYYMGNAKIIKEGLKKAGYTVFGADNAPYIWLKLPNKMKSFDFFDLLLERAAVVGTPGAGFGAGGEGYFRLTAFGGREDTLEALKRIKGLKL